MKDNDIKLPEISEEDQKFLHYNPNTSDVVDFVKQYAIKAMYFTEIYIVFKRYQHPSSIETISSIHLTENEAIDHVECIEQLGDYDSRYECRQISQFGV